jgi:hypothetical protein
MPPAGFEPDISVTKRPQNYALDGEVTGIGSWLLLMLSLKISQWRYITATETSLSSYALYFYL